MKFRVAQLVLFLALASIATFLSGCAGTEPDNASVRPWNTPQSWEGNSLGDMQTQQH